MSTLVIGFVGLVILPALILAEIMNRLVKEPSDFDGLGDNAEFTISSARKATDAEGRAKN